MEMRQKEEANGGAHPTSGKRQGCKARMRGRFTALALASVLLAIAVAGAGVAARAFRTDPPAEQIVALKAYYTGPTQAGTIVDSDSDFAVYAQLEDGEWSPVVGWSVASPVTLERGGLYTLTVVYGELSANADIECSEMDEEQFKVRCVPVTRDELVADPDLDEGLKVRFVGTVCQIDVGQGGSRSTCYVSANGGFASRSNARAFAESGKSVSGVASDDLVAVVLPESFALAVYDNVTVWGRFSEMRSIEVAGDDPVTVPVVKAEYVELAE